jgi:hypothetical protein
MKNYKIQENVLQAVLGYLSTRPYREVSDLIVAIQGSQEIENEIKKDKSDDSK